MKVDKQGYNSAISALERGSQQHLALEILAQMPSASVLPDVISYNATIDACAGPSSPGIMYRVTARPWHLLNGLSIEESIVQQSPMNRKPTTAIN